MMGTEDDIKFEELLKMEDNREINSNYNPQDKQKCSEVRKQDQQEQLTERIPENAATKQHDHYPPKSGFKKLKRQ